MELFDFKCYKVFSFLATVDGGLYFKQWYIYNLCEISFFIFREIRVGNVGNRKFLPLYVT